MTKNKHITNANARKEKSSSDERKEKCRALIAAARASGTSVDFSVLRQRAHLGHKTVDAIVRELDASDIVNRGRS